MSGHHNHKTILGGKDSESGQFKPVGPWDNPVDSQENALLSITSILQRSTEQWGTSFVPGGSDVVDDTGAGLVTLLERGASGLLASPQYLNPGVTGGAHIPGYDEQEGRYLQLYEFPTQGGVAVYWRNAGIGGDHFTFEAYPTFRAKIEPSIPNDELGLFVGLYANDAAPTDVLTGTSPSTAIAGLQFDTNEGDTNYMFAYGNGGSPTRVDTGVAPAADTPVWFEVRQTGFTAADLRFLLLDRDLNVLAMHTPTSGAPAVAQALSATVFFRNLGADSLSADGIRYYQAWMTLGQAASY